MFACICHAVSEREVNDAIDALAVLDPAAVTVASLAVTTLAGTSCGSCHDHLEDLIQDRCGACPLARLQVA